MKRVSLTPRTDWRSRVESQGLTWHADGNQEGWNEEAAYILSAGEIQRLCRAATEAAEIYQRAAAYIINNGLWSLLGLKDDDAPLIVSSWEKKEWSLHGRFDFLLDASGCPKLLEYNAETALSLVETAVIQKHWLAEVMPGFGQFNELEERLLEGWRRSGFKQIHCAWRPRHAEVEGTVRYMAGLMRQAGMDVTLMALHRMGWNSRLEKFVDQDGLPVDRCFKIYPWEWMLRERFASRVPRSGCSFVEPAWRLVHGSKGILRVISEQLS